MKYLTRFLAVVFVLLVVLLLCASIVVASVIVCVAFVAAPSPTFNKLLSYAFSKTDFRIFPEP